MSRKYLNDRWCVRCGKSDPTPFLREMYLKHGDVFQYNRLPVNCLDIGCGNGRNSKMMKSLGHSVTSIDMVNDYGEKCILGKDQFPSDYYGVILANYVLMFLNRKERYQVMREIQKNSCMTSTLVIEMYPAKDAHSYNWDQLVNWFIKRGWTKIVKRKDKCLLRREK